jgi:hypothetical protein
MNQASFKKEILIACETKENQNERGDSPPFSGMTVTSIFKIKRLS